MISNEALQAIEKIIQDEMARKNKALKEACEKLAEYSPRCLPESCMNQDEGYEEGDENAPFFSETYLYNLIGKTEARTLLAIMSPIWEAAGMENQL